MKNQLNDEEVILDICNTIDCLRVKNGQSIVGLANNAEISVHTLKHILGKKTCPSVSTLLHLCNALNISVWQFFLLVESADGEMPHKEYELLARFDKLESKYKELIIYITGFLAK